MGGWETDSPLPKDKVSVSFPGKCCTAVLLPWQVPLVDQHLKNEFSVLQNCFNITAISGDSNQKLFFSEVLKMSDLIICTAQILQNALISQEEEMHVDLTGEHLVGKRCYKSLLGQTSDPSSAASCSLNGPPDAYGKPGSRS